MPSAPASSARRVSAPVAIPPATKTGRLPAVARARGKKSSAGMVPTKWPPASRPWAIKPSAPVLRPVKLRLLAIAETTPVDWSRNPLEVSALARAQIFVAGVQLTGVILHEMDGL
jgi:hypothetical protein